MFSILNFLWNSFMALASWLISFFCKTIIWVVFLFNMQELKLNLFDNENTTQENYFELLSAQHHNFGLTTTLYFKRVSATSAYLHITWCNYSTTSRDATTLQYTTENRTNQTVISKLHQFANRDLTNTKKSISIPGEMIFVQKNIVCQRYGSWKP